MDQKQFEGIIAAILATSGQSETVTRERFNRIRQWVCDDFSNIHPTPTPTPEEPA
jgi:hypothetical protein